MISLCQWKMTGSSILGYATLMWFGRKASSVDARRAIALALLVQDSISCIASLILQQTGHVTPLSPLQTRILELLGLSPDSYTRLADN